MKKSYLMMAAAATMFAACTQADFVNDIPTSAPKAIDFKSPFIGKSTRAENSSSNYTLKFSDHHKDFKVWGYKDVSTTPVFDGKQVNVTLGTGAGSEIYQYDGLVYWDESATNYEFYAAAPAKHDWVFNVPTNDAQDNGYFTTTVSLNDVKIHNDQGAHMTALGDAQDLLIAAPTNVTIGETVGLEFIHILSRLNIIISKKSGMKEEVRSYEVAVRNIPKAGSFNENAAANKEGSYARWTTSGELGEYKATNGQGALVQEGVERHVIQTLVVPQGVTNESFSINGSDADEDSKPYLYVKYGVANATDVNGNATSFEIFEKYYNLAQIFGVTTAGDELPFNEGWENTLTLTIGPATIDFKAAVATWATMVDKENSLNNPN